MTFEDFLRANRLPLFGARLMTPNGTIVTLKRYEFEASEECAVVAVEGSDVEIYWSLDQVRQCTWWRKDKEESK